MYDYIMNALVYSWFILMSKIKEYNGSVLLWLIAAPTGNRVAFGITSAT